MKNNQSSYLIPVAPLISNLYLDIKYATSDNFTKEVIYPVAGCYLLEPVAQALKSAAHEFEQLGYSIKIWDAYRPLRAQSVFWNLVPDPRYVADPQKGSRHNRGCSVDLTLMDGNRYEVDMGTGFDDFTHKAHRDFTELESAVLKNRQLLQEVMEKHGFIGWQNEWWHFDFKDWEKYPLLDIALDEVEPLI